MIYKLQCTKWIEIQYRHKRNNKWDTITNMNLNLLIIEKKTTSTVSIVSFEGIACRTLKAQRWFYTTRVISYHYIEFLFSSKMWLKSFFCILRADANPIPSKSLHLWPQSNLISLLCYLFFLALLFTY